MFAPPSFWMGVQLHPMHPLFRRPWNIFACATISDVRHLSAVGKGPKLKAFFVDSLNGSSEFSSVL